MDSTRVAKTAKEVEECISILLGGNSCELNVKRHDFPIGEASVSYTNNILYFDTRDVQNFKLMPCTDTGTDLWCRPQRSHASLTESQPHNSNTATSMQVTLGFNNSEYFYVGFKGSSIDI